MIATKKRTLVHLTVGISLVGLGAAAVIAYDLNRVVHQKYGTLRPQASQPAALSAATAQEQENVLCIPTITIVGRAGE